MNEFEIIDRYFKKSLRHHNIHCGVGDDAAVFSVPNNDVVTSIDTMVEDVHFLKQISPYDIGYKSLAVSLSDMAAMGAKPFSSLLSLTIPKSDSEWLSEFANGFFDLAKHFNVDLIGGDISRGPLTISTVVNGFIPKSSAIYRHQAKIGDLIYVTGSLGDAGGVLHLLQQNKKPPSSLLNRLNQPTPRVQEGIVLREHASSAIDISDGLIADLKKIIIPSHVGANIYIDRIPISSILEKNVGLSLARKLALTAGDDYELCFTLPSSEKSWLEQAFKHQMDLVHCIGEIVEGSELVVFDENGDKIAFSDEGYDHFR